MSAAELRALLAEKARREVDRGEPGAAQWVRYRGYLVAAFGEADVSTAAALLAGDGT